MSQDGSGQPPHPPWFVWASVASMTCIIVGLYWDISFHLTVGRDTFWTPAHLLIQSGGVLGGVSGSTLIFSTTLRRTSPLRDRSIGVWGFRGPFGAFLSVWGAATMVVSAPFDDWWHRAYGLDVEILSPPHTVLLVGVLVVAAGGVVSVLATLNTTADRTADALRTRLRWILLVVGAEIFVLAMTVIFEYTQRHNLHRGSTYLAISIAAPAILIAFAQASGTRWAATVIAAGYTVFMVGMLWLFALVPAEPKLGPVYQPITHYIPLQFPVLVIVPAIAIDVVRDRVSRWRRGLQAIAIGGVFLAVVVAVEWPFASFLQSAASRNWVFGTHYLPYYLQPESYEGRGEFFPEPTRTLCVGMVKALAAATVTSWIGLTLGGAMRRVRR